MGDGLRGGTPRVLPRRGHALRPDLADGGHYALGRRSEARATELFDGTADGPAPERVHPHPAGSRGNSVRFRSERRSNHRPGAARAIDEYHCQGHGNLAPRPVLLVVVPRIAQDPRRSHGQATVVFHAGISRHAQNCANEARRTENDLQPEQVHPGFHREPGQTQCESGGSGRRRRQWRDDSLIFDRLIDFVSGFIALSCFLFLFCGTEYKVLCDGKSSWWVFVEFVKLTFYNTTSDGQQESLDGVCVGFFSNFFGNT
mmetsp:Transcript_6728/g.16147  ORF Transcript_6728/g.16147 Transcript_6728/m.16147 type:complete len:258 (+) Transcript_6728:620-1393(+)